MSLYSRVNLIVSLLFVACYKLCITFQILRPDFDLFTLSKHLQVVLFPFLTNSFVNQVSPVSKHLQVLLFLFLAFSFVNQVSLAEYVNWFIAEGTAPDATDFSDPFFILFFAI